MTPAGSTNPSKVTLNLVRRDTEEGTVALALMTVLSESATVLAIVSTVGDDRLLSPVSRTGDISVIPATTGISSVSVMSLESIYPNQFFHDDKLAYNTYLFL
jgi:hypothetical protein